ncbi:MAG: hypothetical protein HQ519_15500 [Planctomycetes bacterium]|nr:hypothetical protein [Planctomycetota bacterium]
MKPRFLIAVISLIAIAAFLLFKEGQNLADLNQAGVHGSSVIGEGPKILPNAKRVDDIEFTPSRQPLAHEVDQARLTLGENDQTGANIEIASLLPGKRQTIAGATGFLLPISDLNDGIYDQRRIQDLGYQIELACKYGAPISTGAKGRVSLPRPKGNLLVYLEKEDRSGVVWHYSGNSKPIDVPLHFTAGVLVRALDAKLQPVPNLEIRLHRSRGTRSSSEQSVRTNSKGECYLAALGKCLAEIDDNVVYSIVPLLALSAQTLQETEWPRLSAEMIEKGEVDLILPGLATLRVSLINSDGTALTDLATVRLRTLPAVGGAKPFPGGASAEAKNAIAVFAQVGLNGRFELGLSLNGEMHPFLEVIQGPTEVGEVLELEFVVPPQPMITATLLDRTGSPLAHHKVRLDFRTDGSTRFTAEATTDENGWFSTPQVAHKDRGINGGVPLELESTGADQKIYRWRMDDLPEGFQNRDLNLGEIRMDTTDPLVAGKVIDADGNPAEGCWLNIDAIVPEGALPIPLAMVQSDAQGSFTFETTSQTSPSYVLQARASGHVIFEMEVAAGQTDLLIQLQRPGRIQGSLILDENISIWDLLITLDGEKVNLNNGLRPTTQPAAFDFDIETSPAESHQLLIRTKLDQTILHIENLRLDPASPLHPVSLQPLDLRSKLKHIQLRCLDPDGEKLIVTYRIPPSGDYQTQVQSQRHLNDESGFLAYSPIAEIQAEAFGYQTTQIHNVWESQTITMRPLDTAQIRIPVELTQLSDFVPNIFAKASADQSNCDCTPFNEEGYATIYLPASGGIKLELALTYKKIGAIGFSTPAQNFGSIQPGQVVDLKPDMVAITKFLEQAIKH